MRFQKFPHHTSSQVEFAFDLKFQDVHKKGQALQLLLLNEHQVNVRPLPHLFNMLRIIHGNFWSFILSVGNIFQYPFCFPGEVYLGPIWWW